MNRTTQTDLVRTCNANGSIQVTRLEAKYHPPNRRIRERPIHTLRKGTEETMARKDLRGSDSMCRSPVLENVLAFHLVQFCLECRIHPLLLESSVLIPPIEVLSSFVQSLCQIIILSISSSVYVYVLVGAYIWMMFSLYPVFNPRKIYTTTDKIVLTAVRLLFNYEENCGFIFCPFIEGVSWSQDIFRKSFFIICHASCKWLY